MDTNQKIIAGLLLAAVVTAPFDRNTGASFLVALFAYIILVTLFIAIGWLRKSFGK